MDKDKQPGIKCDSIILAESVFKRLPQLTGSENVNLSMEVNNTFSDDKKTLQTILAVHVNTENDPIYFKVVYVGLFSVSEEQNMELEEFAKSNAPAIMFPYIREEIHSKMLKASLPKSIIIPPINIGVLVQENKK
ncbi:MAG TPA: protein-export chaperone SecB [Candidatus Dojkabacteria bacterium]|nr:protein-export chaperone SecB [Candidatus Dojkabacteria bacterium]